MATFRLFNVDTKSLESFSLEDHPPYIAASHSWSENVVPPDTPFQDSFGGRGLHTVIRDRHQDVRYCWFDTLCIDQSNEDDKLEQIPLMDRIFGNAACVVVFISTELGFTQPQVDWLTGKLQGALAMCEAEAWREEGAYWQSGEGRNLLFIGLKGLQRLASTSWASRIWTLQEYVLAKSILWIGSDLQPVELDDFAFSAIPDICETLSIEECLVEEFYNVQAYLRGMATARLKAIDRTRIMELPGNRKATVPVDEVYGVMAASGVQIKPVSDETKVQAWSRWCEEAVRQRHIRWILLPASSAPLLDGEQSTCVLPRFSERHELSGSSGLDTIKPFGRVCVENGTVTTTVRVVGTARFIRRLGRIHEPEHGSIYRDITLILFAESKWSLALKLVWAFGSGRYDTRQARSIAQVLVQSYARAVRCVASRTERYFRPMLSSNFQQYVWNDFTALQQSKMMGVNSGVAHLIEIQLKAPLNLSVLTIVGLGGFQHTPTSNLKVLDFEARASDGRPVLMIVQPAKLEDGISIYHKIGMTLGISEDVADLWVPMRLEEIEIGGFSCSSCRVAGRPSLSQSYDQPDRSISCIRQTSSLRRMERDQERTRFKLFSTKPSLSRRKQKQVCTRVQARRWSSALERSQVRFRSAVAD